MKFAINQATTMKADFATDVKAYARAGFDSMEIWLPKLKDYLKMTTLADVKKLLTEQKIKPVGACYQNNLMFSQGELRQQATKEFMEKLEICNELEIPVLVVPGDNPPVPVTENHYDEAAENILKVADDARRYGVKLALEFIAKAKFLGCLSTTIKLVDKINHKNVGILFDTFHFFSGISKMEDIDKIKKGNSIFMVHFNDVADKPGEILTDRDRVLPGEGIIPLDTIIKKLQKINYCGYYSLELFNEKLWDEDPYSVAKKCFESLEKFWRKP
ncbi:MAG TPA: sugar phosphate isomerase/epimerase family protein [bacterium]|nr:sugar phosphate isomerase/epimerase family protein [bacterium]HOL35004.1 sugar phosphate isomerase/epimerase family protein [bacterium]HPP07985.1 sugar phosphate isomerase/epimerase family protein [bacterium]